MITIDEPISFQWDAGNRDKNWKHHQVSQEEAEQVFLDPHKLVAKDTAHSHQEARYIIIGETYKQRLLFVVFTMRKGSVRVISARDMKRSKRAVYYHKKENYEKAA